MGNITRQLSPMNYGGDSKMKKSWVVLVVGLFIVTSLYAVPFTVATGYTASDQSITSFEETLPNDVLYYPDVYYDGILYFATGGDEEYNNTFEVDSLYFAPTAPSPEIDFDYDTNIINQIEYFTYSIYANSTDEIADMHVFSSDDGATWGDSFVSITTEGWYNGTEYRTLGSTGTFYLYFQFTGFVDYVDIAFGYMTLSTETNYLTDSRFATGGNPEYNNTFEVDSIYYEPTAPYPKLWFDSSDIDWIESFTYSIYGNSTSSHLYVYYSIDGIEWSETFEDITSENWYNGTESDVFLEPTARFYLYFQFEGFVDYVEIAFCYLVLGENSYADSFADVSDWVDETGGTLATDGDTMTLEMSGSGWGWQGGAYTNSPSFSAGEWITTEISVDRNASVENLRLYIYGFSLDNKGGDDYLLGVINGVYLTDGWQTYKASMELVYDLESVRFLFRVNDNYTFYADYLRIGPSNEMGFQHDGSTTIGISSSDGGTIESDGDLSTLTADGNGSSFLIVADTTTTATAISCTYYPMFAIEIDSGFNSWGLEQYDGSAYATLQTSTLILSGIYRFNMESLDTYVESWRINLTANAVFVWDWAKPYSIANFSAFSQHANMDTNDYFYTDAGILYFENDESSGPYIRMNYDPALDIDYETYILVNSTVFKDGLQSDLVGYNWIDSGGILEDAWNASLTQDLTGSPYLKIDDAGTWEIHDLTFLSKDPEWHDIDVIPLWFDVAGWNIIEIILLRFAVEISTYTLNLFFLFLGLVMIPTSSIYLVKGGRSEMSMDKVFFGLVIFILGCALFIGGIFV